MTSEGGATGVCGTTADAISVTSPFSSIANGFPPTVCGTLTGQHMYFETGTSGTTAGTLSIVKGTDAGSRTYDIKATFFTCDDVAKAPEGCTQYFTGPSGSFQSYNFANGQILANQNYRHCVRREFGYCRLEIRASSVATPNSFFLSGPESPLAAETACQDVNYITFPTDTLASFCGGFLNSEDTFTSSAAQISSPGAPFEVGLRSLTAASTGKTGFNLDYTQIPCV